MTVSVGRERKLPVGVNTGRDRRGLELIGADHDVGPSWQGQQNEVPSNAEPGGFL